MMMSVATQPNRNAGRAGASSSRERLGELLASADIELNGARPWDMRVNDERFYGMAFGGSLAVGEAYMDGLWDCDRLDELVYRFRRANLEDKFRLGADGMQVVKAKLINLQSRTRSYGVGDRVYDITPDVFEATLDSRRVYSCAYWKNASNLEEAQVAKLDLACRKLQLRPGMTVLDVGCGWSSFVKYAAEEYGVNVVGVTVSREQVAYGQRLCAGLPVEVRYQDYRELTGSFDRVFSAGMFEHVGYKNYRRFFETVRRCLKDDGLFLLHTIGGNESLKAVDPWIDKYIFPNCLMPSCRQIADATEDLFVMEDWHNFGPDYDKTLVAWFENFNGNWPQLRDKYDERFYRMWKFYLLTCAGLFRSRKNHLWHIVFSRDGVPGGYESIR
jgi:cyclopropane-fatty-acyl-phospholipid synthase